MTIIIDVANLFILNFIRDVQLLSCVCNAVLLLVLFAAFYNVVVAAWDT